MKSKEKTSPLKTGATQRRLFARQPISLFGKFAIGALLGAAATSSLLAITIGFPANMALLIVTGGLLGGAGLATIRLRWMPLLITLLSGLFLYQLLRAPFVLYHLTNPKGHAFFPFVMDLIMIACTMMTLGASIGAAVQNYRQGGERPSRHLPLALTGLVVGVVGMLLGATLIAAIAQPGTIATGSTAYTNGVPTVHMSAATFTRSSTTIAKGSKLLLVDDVSVVHILANGFWQNGTVTATNELGAPKVANIPFNDNSTEIGPFTTAGIYHIYCTVHVGMNLTIIVH